jgi:hypothetical protein
LAPGDPLRAVALAGMMAVVSGVMCILIGVARLGFVTELLSKPIRCGYMNGIDVTGADMPAERETTLYEAGVEFCFAEFKDSVKDKLKRFGLFARFGEDAFLPTVGAAVGHYLERHAVDWADWEDADPPRRGARSS